MWSESSDCGWVKLNVEFDQLAKKYVTDATSPSNMVTIGWTVQKCKQFVYFQDVAAAIGFCKNVIFDQCVVKNVTATTSPSNMVTIGWTVQDL